MKASEEIRSILDRCKSGELKHNQQRYFCKSSRCLAGWKIHFDYCGSRSRPRPTDSCLRNFAENNIRGYKGFQDSEWEYARRAWGLTWEQADRLFVWFTTFDEQYKVVAELEAEGK